MELEPPFDTFRIEKHAGERKDFGLAPDDPYPLKGVTYPVDYGDIQGYTGEDGVDLDLFVGSAKPGLRGLMKVWRPELPAGETKFYVALTEDEEKAMLEEFKPVLTEHRRFATIDEMIEAMDAFKDEQQA